MAQQQTVTEREMYLQQFEHEFQTTLRLLKAYPPAKADLKPAEKSKTARELAWMLVLNQMVPKPVMEGALEPGKFPTTQPPQEWPELIAAFENAHRDAMVHFRSLTDETMNEKVRMPVAPKTMGDKRIGDALWYFLSDTVHHRGQFTIYTRIAGGKVPSIYGPTADEPWF